MVLDICAEGLWIRADFLHEVGWHEWYAFWKISFPNFTFRALMSMSYSPLEGNNKGCKTKHKCTTIELFKHLKYHEFSLCHGKMKSKDFKNFLCSFNSQFVMSFHVCIVKQIQVWKSFCHSLSIIDVKCLYL